MDDEVLYRRFESPVEAEILAGLLRSEGIRVRIADAQSIRLERARPAQMNRTWAVILDGVALVVVVAIVIARLT